MIIQEGRVSKVQRYRRGGLCTAKGTEIFPELERGISCKGGREEELFLTTNSNIHIVPQTLVALPIRRRLRSSEFKKDTSLQLNEPSGCTIQPRREGRNTPTSNRGESVKNCSKREIAVK